MRHPLVLIAAGVWLFAWGRLLVNTATTPSPAHEVVFLDAAGASAERPNCHGPAWVIDGTLWMMCGEEGGGTDHLTRYDLAAGTAQLVRPLEGNAWRGASAATRHPDGGVVFVDGDSAVLRWLPDGTWTDLGLPGHKSNPCVAWVNGALEVAYGVGGGAAVARSKDGVWTIETSEGPPRVEGWDQRFESCEVTPEGWRLTWLRAPQQIGAGPVPIDLWEQVGPTGELREAGTLSFDPGGRLERVRVNEGRVYVESGLLDRTGGLARWHTGPPFVRGADGAWQSPAVPPAAHTGLTGSDLVFGGPRAGHTVTFDLGRVFARVEGRWFAPTDTKIWQMTELGPDLATPARTGPPMVNQFWLRTGFKMLPDDADGYWLMGALGEAYVHLDANLERTDEHGFFGRFARALSTDRAKRNSDFYYEIAIVKKAAFVWVLLGLPLLFGVLRRRLPIAAGVYLIGTAAGGWWWWKLSGVFW